MMEKTLQSFRLTTGIFSATVPPRTCYEEFFTTQLEKAEIPDRYQGIATYRYADNPKEKLWAMFFFHKNTNPATGHPKGEFAQLLVGPPTHGAVMPEDVVTDRDLRVMASAFQWMGSPVGHAQLIELLCSLPQDNREYIIQRLQQAHAV